MSIPLVEGVASSLLAALVLWVLARVWASVFASSDPPQGEAEMRRQLLQRAKEQHWGRLDDLTRRLPGGGRAEVEVSEIGDLVAEHRDGAGDRALILGRAGAGKTIAAYQWAEQQEESGQVPVVFRLADWTRHASIEEWMAERISDPLRGYGVGTQEDARQMVASGRLSIVFDGLDDVPALLRASVYHRLVEFLRRLPSKEAVVVTCRTDEFRSLVEQEGPDGRRLDVHRTLEVQPLRPSDVRRRLSVVRAGDNTEDATEASVPTDDGVISFLGTPLFLDQFGRSALSIGDLASLEDTHAMARLVLESSVAATLDQPAMPAGAPTFLALLAGRGGARERGAFYFEDLLRGGPLPLGHVARRLIGAITAYAVAVGVSSGFLFGASFETGPTAVLGAVAGLPLGVAVGAVVFAYVSHPAQGLLEPIARSRSVPDGTVISRTVQADMALLVVVAVLTAVLGVIVAIYETLWTGVVFWAFGTVIDVTFVVIYRSFRRSHIVVQPTEPDLGLTLSKRSAAETASIWFAFSTVSALVVVGPLIGWRSAILGGISFGALVAPVMALVNGGGYVLAQRRHRALLRRQGWWPESSEAVIEWAEENDILRVAGGGYHFRHDLVRHAFAESAAFLVEIANRQAPRTGRWERPWLHRAPRHGDDNSPAL